MREPRGVYLSALESRLSKTCPSLSGSARIDAKILQRGREQRAQLHPLAGEARAGGFEAGKRQQVVEQRVQALGVSLDGFEELVAVGEGNGVVRIHQGLDVALDHRKGRAQFMRDVGNEILAHIFKAFLPRDVVQDKEQAGGFVAVERADHGTRDLQPSGAARIDELDFLARLGATGADRLDVSEKRVAAKGELDALPEDATGLGENRMEGLVGEQDVIV